MKKLFLSIAFAGASMVVHSQQYRHLTEAEKEKELRVFYQHRKLTIKYYEMLMALPYEHRIHILTGLLEDNHAYVLKTRQNTWSFKEQIDWQTSYLPEYFKGIPNIIIDPHHTFSDGKLVERRTMISVK
jgi:hypothetical protein